MQKLSNSSLARAVKLVAGNPSLTVAQQPTVKDAACGCQLSRDKKRGKKKKNNTPNIAASRKFASLVDSIKYHLPRIRKLDTVVGAGLGAAGGLTYTAARDLLSPRTEENAEDRSGYLHNALLGGAIGATGANVVGDRARRYVTNAVETTDYGSHEQLSDLLPGSLKRFYDLAIHDRRHYVRPSDQPEINNEAARELWRRGMRLPVRDPVFSATGDNTYGYSSARLNDLRGFSPEFVLGRHVREDLGNGKAVLKDRYDFGLHPQEKDNLPGLLRQWWAGGTKVNPDAVDLEYARGDDKTSLTAHLRSTLLRLLAQSALSGDGVNVSLKEYRGSPVAAFPKDSAANQLKHKFAALAVTLKPRRYTRDETGSNPRTV